MSKKRILTISLVLIVVTLVALGSWIAGSTIQSPAEAAARTAAPAPSPILVEVEARVLNAEIVTRGTARFDLPQSIAIAPSTLKANVGIITTLPVRNTQLQAGEVMLTASGRPVFLLQGGVPAYRDLAPGLSGEDVMQLERGLAKLGFAPGPVDGLYDDQTSQAVTDWYLTAGFQPFAATADQLANIRGLEQELAIAINDKAAADAAVAAAPLAVEAVRASVDQANKLALAEVTVKTEIRDKVSVDPAASVYDRENANADLAVAEASVEATRLAGEVEVQRARADQAAAEREVERLTNLVARITADLELAQAKTLTQLPIDEIIFLSELPVRVEELNVTLGDAASGPLMKVTNNQLVIDSSLRLEEAPLVKPDMAVAIDEPDLGLKATGVVGRVAETPGTFGVDGFHIYFEVLVDETPLSLVGTSLRLNVPIESTGGEVTAVPVNALSLAADGTSRVQVDHNGVLEFVVVEPGLSTGSYVEVNPLDGTLEAGDLVVIGFEQK